MVARNAGILVALFFLITQVGAQSNTPVSSYFQTYVNDDHVNIRQYPTTESKAVYVANKGNKVVVMGMTQFAVPIGGIKSYWLFVRYKDMSDPSISGAGGIGWIYGKYVAMPKDTKPNKISIDLANKLVNSAEGEIAIKPVYSYDKKYAVFSVDDQCDGFHYNDTPGIYLVGTADGAIIKITYDGVGYPSNGITLDSGGMYAMVDQGTGPPPRSFVAINCWTGQTLVRGTYYKDFELFQDSITIMYSEYTGNLKDVEQRYRKYGEMLQGDVEKGMDYNSIGYFYRYNLMTAKRYFIGIRYFYGS